MPKLGDERRSGGVDQIYTKDGKWENVGYAPNTDTGPRAEGFGKIPEELGKTRTPKDALSFADLEKFQTALTNITTDTGSIQDNMGIILDMLALEDTLRVDISKSIGMSNEQLFDTINELNEAGESAARFGLTVNDLFDTFKEITLEVGRKLRISPEVTERATLLTKTLDGFNASDFAKGFDDIGFSLDKAVGGVDESNNAMSEILDTGRGFGVVMEKFLGNVTSQLKLVNTYGFERGVEGLARMVARGQTLGLEMSTVTSLADKFFDPEGAIDFAAQMQVIGGAVGDLQDPFKLMYMATNDLEGLQEAIIDTAAAAVTFDEDKGKFVISPEQRRQLRDMAEAMGMSYQDLADTAVKSARRAEAFSEMQFLDNVTEEDKELIAGMAAMGEGGEMQVKIPSLDKMVDIDSLTAEQIDELKVVGMTDSDIYAQQLTVAEKTNQYLATIDTGIRKMVREGGGDTEGMMMSSLSQTLGESMELLTAEQLGMIGKGDMGGFMENFSDPENAPTGLTPEGTKKILEGLTKMGLYTAPIEADDFILRPGQAPVKFNEGDLILGGTELDGGQGGDITNKINNVSNLNTTNTPTQTGPIELTGTLTVKGEGENATVNVKKLLSQLSSGDLQNLSMMLSNATA